MYTVKQAEAGVPVAEVARKYGVSLKTIYAWRNKSLSQNRQSVDDEGTCEMYQPPIVLHPLLEADEEFPEPIVPGPWLSTAGSR